MSELGEKPGLKVLTKSLLGVAENEPERPCHKAVKNAARYLGLAFQIEE